MKTGIIIGSHESSVWAFNCYSTLHECGYEIKVDHRGGFELGSIRRAYEETDWDEFLFLQDSTEVKTFDWIHDMFTIHESKSVACCSCPAPYGSFLGKYRREVLAKIDIPETPDKMSAIHAETEWTARYCAIEQPIILWPEMVDNDRRETKFGQDRMVLESSGLKKYKGSAAGFQIVL